MITIYDSKNKGLISRDTLAECEKSVWIDLLNPTKAEEAEMEALLGLEVPTREEMSEIEASSRIYQENGAHFMTASVLYLVETPDPQATAITFIMTDTRLVTVRYAQPKAFTLFLSRASKGDAACDTPMDVLLGLIEAIIDREADLIERMQSESEKLAQVIFDMKGGSKSRTGRFDIVLKQIGRVGEIVARARESLLSQGRVLSYVATLAAHRNEGEPLRQRIRTEEKDVQSLSDHLHYLNARINFMLDASLGMVSIEQNQIIKLFSVVAVMLMPPTLVASVYGMNFKHMPELGWELGYPMAIALMILSALLPYLFFRRRGWL